MMASKAIPMGRVSFPLESPKSVRATSSRRNSSSSRRKSGYGVVTMASNNSVRDPHTTLEVAPGASKLEIKKAYRRLALQYHPDVCEGNHCTTQFQQIKFAYETLMNKATPQSGEFEEDDCSNDFEGFAGAGNDSWEDWEEWMGWEGAGTLDYSNHVNYAV